MLYKQNCILYQIIDIAKKINLHNFFFFYLLKAKHNLYSIISFARRNSHLSSHALARTHLAY